MKLLKPLWVADEGKPFFSIDIHPDGTRFATGGQGDDAGKVVVWNMAPVRSESDEMNNGVPKILCCMSNHLGCVNCVRWSRDGSCLASGGDDSLIMIWQLRAQGPSLAGPELWSCAHILRSHSGDVMDLAWSPDSSQLASCSVDNTIIVWNATCLPNVTAILRGHNGLVKGVTWDPVGKYLASQSDDKTVRVWRTSDWKQEMVVKGPFEGCGGTTHVLRLGWSPDGQSLVSAHALNNQGPVAKIISRNGWTHDSDFVGHRKAVEVVRFNPQLLAKDGETAMFSCCAVGSRDRSLSVWLTSLRRPLVVIHDLFNESVVDISWSSTGYELMLCSLDGTVIYIELNEKELGKPVSDQRKDQWFIEHYGRSVGQSRESKQLIEDPSLLSLQQKSLVVKHKDVMSVHMAMPVNSGKTSGQGLLAPLPPFVKGLVSASSSSTTSPVKEKQRETVTKDGRRRITPFSISLQSGGFAPNLFGSSTPFPPTQGPAQNSVSQSTETSTQAQPFNEKTILKSTTPTALQVTSTPPRTDRIKSTDTSPASSKVGSKRKKDDTGMATKKPRRDQTASAAISTTASVRSGRDDCLSISISSTATITLPQPDVLAQRTLQVVHAVSGQEINVTLEIANSNVPGRAHKIVCRHGNTIRWETFLNSKGVALSGSRHIVAVACENRTVHVFSSCGRRLLPGLVLSSAISVLQCNEYYLMAVTTGGDVFVWDMKRLCAVIRKQSLLPVLKGNKVNITKVQLTADGLPIISLSSQCSYTFNPELGVWVLLDDGNDVVRLSANVQSYAPPEVEGLLASLQGKCVGRSSMGHLPRVYARDASQQRMATVAFLENQVTAALACQSSDEYHHWLLSYVKYLTSQGIESQLQELCVELMGPPGQSVRKLTSTQGWDPLVLGLSKRNLLKEMLPILGVDNSCKWQPATTSQRDS